MDRPVPPGLHSHTSTVRRRLNVRDHPNEAPLKKNVNDEAGIDLERLIDVEQLGT